MAKSTVEPTGNRLLARLPKRSWSGSGLTYVSFALGEVIYESGWRQNHIHFPTTAILDRGGLGKAVCEGYKVVKDAYDRLLAGASVYFVKPDSSELIPTIRRLLAADAG